MKSEKKAACTAALGNLASMVCTCRRVDCNSVFGTDNEVIAIQVRKTVGMLAR